MPLVSPFLRPTHDLERDQRVDAVVSRLEPIAERVGHGPAGPALRGEWLGHALHPMLTDFPLGCWASAAVLDLVGGASSRAAAQRLVGLGVAMVPATAAAGLADYSSVKERGTKRVGAAHAVGNVLVAWLYLMSWRHRRKGRHLLGVLLGLMGGALAVVTGYLGGHLSFGRSAGASERGEPGEGDIGSGDDTGGEPHPEALFGMQDPADAIAAVESELS